MAECGLILVTGAAGGIGGVGHKVVAQLRQQGHPVRALAHHDDARADALREPGAGVVIGDLTRLTDVATHLRDARHADMSAATPPSPVTIAGRADGRSDRGSCSTLNLR